MRDFFPRFCDRTRRNLHAVIEEVRKELLNLTSYAQQPYRIVYSIPIPVCKFGRARFHKTFKDYGATHGKCPSKKETYLGYKLHMLVTLDGFVTDFVITSANIDDREGAWDLVNSYQKITLIGDKGYIGNDFASELKSEKGITFLPIKRSNPYTYSCKFVDITF